MKYGVPDLEKEKICPFCHGELDRNKAGWFLCRRCHRAFDENKLKAEHERMKEKNKTKGEY